MPRLGESQCAVYFQRRVVDAANVLMCYCMPSSIYVSEGIQASKCPASAAVPGLLPHTGVRLFSKRMVSSVLLIMRCEVVDIVSPHTNERQCIE